ncbi:MAG TPA: undecaprenyl-diphosphate phosphatase [Clostridiales bacterium]|nr:undecaprenyl-diphosphate phosphatase [Clostridiales bacterium]
MGRRRARCGEGRNGRQLERSPCLRSGWRGEVERVGTGQAVLLGLVQGITEFLPVSSSAHLVLAQALLGIEPPGLTLEIAVHLGTLAAVVAVFARDLGQLLRAGGRMAGVAARGASSREHFARDPGARLLVLLALASGVTAALGLTGEPWLRGAYEEPEVAATLLLVTGAILWGAGRLRPGTRPLAALDWRDGLLVGAAQGVAILPGISRSGTTIAAGLMTGLDRDAAARFSFLLSVPAILGATLLEAVRLGPASLLQPGLEVTLPAMVSAAVTGFLAVTGLLRLVRRGRLGSFAYYCWVVGGGSLLWLTLAGG